LPAVCLETADLYMEKGQAKPKQINIADSKMFMGSPFLEQKARNNIFA
jgi:hypothetical protein